MSRKLQKAIWRDGEIRRRSPRISALDACKSNDDQRRQQHQQSQPRMKRKFDDDDDALAPSTSKLAKQVWKGRDSTQQNEDQATKCVEWRSRVVQENKKHQDSAISNGEASVLPEKHVLELVLDTLQRRDTNEIFAEPVDADEVEDYYDIIKEPMDFGTMRAKLHENMYQNLEQFEHDVFLIPENAMYFNSSATIYFRQARAIHDLAKKVFDALRADPENFVLEFSGTRRRSMRKALSETKDSRPLFSKSSVDVSLKGKLDASSTLIRRNNKKNHGFAGYFRSRNLLTSNRFSRLSSSDIGDRRSTYLTWRSSSYDHEDYVGSTLYTSSKSLFPMNRGDISYEDSLLHFAKDLGPIAQKVARRKLLGHHVSNSEKCLNSWTTQMKSGNNANDGLNTTNPLQTFRDFASDRRPFLKTTNNVIDLTKDGEESNVIRNREKQTTLKAPEGSNVPTNIVKKTSKNTEMRSKVSCLIKNSSATPTTTKSTRISDDNNADRPVILALENPRHSNVSEYKGRNSKKSWPALAWSEEAKDKGAAAAAMPPPPAPLVSPFTFDIPFLKARLSQMNVAMERSGVDKGGGGGGLNNGTQLGPGNSNNFFLYNQKNVSNNLDTNLALQL